MTFSFSKVRFFLSCGPANNTARPAMRIFWPVEKTHRSGSFGSFENSVQWKPNPLGSTAPRLLTYPRETVVAEKLEAMVKLGIANSRMKDFYDMEVLCRTFSFDGKTLRDAIRNTFKRRGTELPLDGTPLAFTLDFYEDVNKIRQWIAFSEKNRSYVEPIEFKTLVARIAKFLVPVTSAARRNVTFTKAWKPGGPWS